MKEKTPRWTKESIISRIQELHAQGVQMNNKSIQQADKLVFEAAKYHFKSVRSAIEAAGYKYQSAQQHWTAERVIKTIQAAHSAGILMRTPDLERYAPGVRCACYTYFDNPADAIIKAGFELGWKPNVPVLRPRKTIAPTPVIPATLRPAAFELFHDALPKNRGVVLNSIASPLGMSEAQRMQQGG